MTKIKKLKLQIESFSYRKGFPEDLSGHGGGYVFDCRVLPNPGREQQFKKLSGKSASVKRYLRGRSEATKYFKLCRELVSLAVKEYQRRGFDSLSVAFGCTGGQHRSVFMAEKLAQIYRKKSGIKISLRHRDLKASLAMARKVDG